MALHKPVLVAVVNGITRDGAELLAIATQDLRMKDMFATTTVTQRLHHTIHVILKYLCQLQQAGTPM